MLASVIYERLNSMKTIILNSVTCASIIIILTFIWLDKYSVAANFGLLGVVLLGILGNQFLKSD